MSNKEESIARKKPLCGHFKGHWTKVYTEDGSWWIRYCSTCREAVERRPLR
ncbi:MAG: hypothetical protein Q8R28_14210 [Dehalococcoidia bacterium]|nr:hypothetical protein [Dehalococcoidia bacterium]